MDRTYPTRRAERALDAGLDYARQVAGGDLAAHPWTRAAAHRFEHDIAEAEAGGRWVFDRDHALRPIAFAAEMLKVEGARMILTPWQSWITAAIFGFVDGERGVRRIRQAVILAGDPAAHVALVAALALSAVFCEGGKSGEAFASPVVFDAARRMIEASKGFRESWKVRAEAELIQQGGTGGTTASLRWIAGDGVAFDLIGADVGKLAIEIVEPEGRFFVGT